ncbi:hypothetical protein SAMN04487904_106148 [Actinopolyspora lacussalsi subsp. righensis]|uniref:DUF4190 domain-containing protein n=1 Tax=Actinopolyspora righensis TaxID=995060 RepID=A0A1I7A978_9ACTN|nr:hypothetical protein [Actinopolyspora righensis]SFT71400.1 hypothetical protein SAMN04487904_106148 [Actinopolyspora righensis]
MSRERIPARHRPGPYAWLGPVALCLGIASWVLLVPGVVCAVGAVVCGAASVTTRGDHRLDITALLGIALGAAHVLVSIMLLLWTMR